MMKFPLSLNNNNIGPIDVSESYNIITLGYDCSPAQALIFLGLRKFALPFDWNISSVASLERCFQDKFSMFHKNLRYNSNKTRLIDHYGFEFPHDYPLMKDVVDCSLSSEVVKNTIVDNWSDYHSEVCVKYQRRIDRFLNIMNDSKPIIVLCRHDIRIIPKIKSLFERYYNKQNVFFVNSTPQTQNIRHNLMNIGVWSYMVTCNTEKNGNWNDKELWKEVFDQGVKRFIIH